MPSQLFFPDLGIWIPPFLKYTIVFVTGSKMHLIVYFLETYIMMWLGHVVYIYIILLE